MGSDITGIPYISLWNWNWPLKCLKSEDYTYRLYIYLVAMSVVDIVFFLLCFFFVCSTGFLVVRYSSSFSFLNLRSSSLRSSSASFVIRISISSIWSSLGLKEPRLITRFLPKSWTRNPVEKTKKKQRRKKTITTLIATKYILADEEKRRKEALWLLIPG